MPATYGDIREEWERVEEYEISYRTLHTACNLKNDADLSFPVITAPYMDILSKYRSALKDIVVEVELDDAMAREYAYNPKMLSEELYNTTEFWFTLLQLNHCTTISQFHPTKKISFYDPYALKDALNEILILEGLLN